MTYIIARVCVLFKVFKELAIYDQETYLLRRQFLIKLCVLQIAVNFMKGSAEHRGTERHEGDDANL